MLTGQTWLIALDKRDWARDSVKRDLRVAWTTEVFLALFLRNLYSAWSILQFDWANLQENSGLEGIISKHFFLQKTALKLELLFYIVYCKRSLRSSPSTVRTFKKKSLVRFLYCAGPVANLSLAWLLRGLKSSLRSLRNSWTSISRKFQWFFQKLCHHLAIFLDCSRSPCRSLLISKPTLCKTILSSSFVLESRTKTVKLFFLLWRLFTFHKYF